MEGILLSDVEGVLLDAEFLPNLADRQGEGEVIRDITEKGIGGEISWEDGLNKRIEILRGTSYEDALQVGEDMPYMTGAKDLCGELKERGYIQIAVTGGFTLFSDRIKEELGLDYMISNELKFEDGRLAGIKELRVKEDKIDKLEEILRKEGAEKKEVVAVADGANNLKLFEHADKKIAFNAQPIIEEHADIVVGSKDLREVLKYIP